MVFAWTFDFMAINLTASFAERSLLGSPANAAPNKITDIPTSKRIEFFIPLRRNRNGFDSKFFANPT